TMHDFALPAAPWARPASKCSSPGLRSDRPPKRKKARRDSTATILLIETVYQRRPAVRKASALAFAYRGLPSLPLAFAYPGVRRASPLAINGRSFGATR